MNEIELIRKHSGLTPSPFGFEPYEPGEVVCLFESDSPTTVLARYGNAIAKFRGLTVGDPLFILEIGDLEDRIEYDRSQNGWPESRICKGNVPVEKIRVVAQTTVQDATGIIRFTEVTFFDIPKPIGEVR